MFDIRNDVIYYDGEPYARLLVPGPTTISHHHAENASATLLSLTSIQCSGCEALIYTDSKAYCDVCAETAGDT